MRFSFIWVFGELFSRIQGVGMQNSCCMNLTQIVDAYDGEPPVSVEYNITMFHIIRVIRWWIRILYKEWNWDELSLCYNKSVSVSVEFIYNVCIRFLLTAFHCIEDNFRILWAWVCRPLLAKSCAVLKYVSSTNDDTGKCLVFFNMELTDSGKLVVICPQRFPSSKHCTHFCLGNWSSHSAALGLFARISPRCHQYIFSVYA